MTTEITSDMSYLLEVSQRISEKKPLGELLCEIMESCKLLMDAGASSLLIYDEKENVLHFQVATGERGEIIKANVCKMGEGIAGWVALHRTPLLIEDCYEDPRFNKEFDKLSNFRTKSMICVPMIHKEKLVGVIQVINKKNDGIFNENDLNIFNILAAQCAISIENARLTEIQIQQKALERELKTARDIQQNLLPDKLPEYSDIRIDATLIPAKAVGGDYYNVYKINHEETLFFVCDVSGKSISAALIVSTIYSSIVTYFEMNKNNFDLIDFVKCLNRVLIESTTEEKYATAWFGLYNHKSKILKSVNAGHNTIFVFNQSGNLIELTKGGFFLGSADLQYQVEEINLNKGDTIVFYTDGVPEAMDKQLGFYGDERLIDTIKVHVNDDPENILKHLLNDVKVFVKDAEQSDDITLGVVRIL